MIKHIVLFRFKNDIDEAYKQHEIREIKAGLEALQGVAPTLRSIEVGVNCNPAEKYDLALVATFENLDDLNAYAVHPEHVKVSGQIRAMLESRACNDFEY